MFSFVALDVETSNYNRSSLCSIGLVKFIDGQIVERFYTLINPEEDFSKKNIKVHGITPEDVKDSPNFPTVRQEIYDFIDGLPVVAHNASFDFSVMKAVYEKYGLRFDPIEYCCTYRFAKVLYPEFENHKLNTLAQNFDFPLLHHNALSDAEVCGYLLLKMIDDTKKDNLKQFSNSLGYPDLGLLGAYGFSKKGKPSATQVSSQYAQTGEKKKPDFFFLIGQIIKKWFK